VSLLLYTLAALAAAYKILNEKAYYLLQNSKQKAKVNCLKARIKGGLGEINCVSRRKKFL